MATASVTTFNRIMDNLASQVAFLDAHVTPGVNGTMRALAVQLLDYLLEADQCDEFVFSERLLRAAEDLTRELQINGILPDRVLRPMLEAANVHFGDISVFAVANDAPVPPEVKAIIEAFLGSAVGVDAVFAPEITLGTIAITGICGIADFTKGSELDPSVYPDTEAVLEVLDNPTGDSNVDYSVTLRNSKGNTFVEVATIPNHSPVGTKVSVGSGTFIAVDGIALVADVPENVGDLIAVKTVRLRPLTFSP